MTNHQPRISIIVAIAKNRAIGKNNRLLWHIPEDLQRFKKLTWGQPVIMGQKTFESLKKPLPGRFNIVLTRDRQLKIRGCSMAHSISDALKLAQAQNPQEIFFIGGGSVYQQALPLASRLYLTLVEAEPQADTFFPDYSQFNKIISQKKSADKNYRYRFLILEKSQPAKGPDKKFVVIEGIDGAGTTTQVGKLAARIFENYKEYPVMLTREPTNGKYGQKIRQLLKRGQKPSENGPRLLALFVKDRREHLRKIRNFEGVVISDRHKHSTFAYQQAQGLPFEKIYQKHKGMPAPDLTIILDVPVKKVFQRMAQRPNKEIFEKNRQFLEAVRKNYLVLKKQLDEPIEIIRGDDTRDKVAQKIWQKVEKLLK